MDDQKFFFRIRYHGHEQHHVWTVQALIDMLKNDYGSSGLDDDIWEVGTHMLRFNHTYVLCDDEINFGDYRHLMHDSYELSKRIRFEEVAEDTIKYVSGSMFQYEIEDFPDKLLITYQDSHILVIKYSPETDEKEVIGELVWWMMNRVTP